MKTAFDIIERIGMYEKAGLERPDAIEIVKIEQMMIMNNRLTAIAKHLRKDGDNNG